MTTGIPHSPRGCGECEECCSVIAVNELRKPYHTRCEHQTGMGCAIYGSHPSECRDYACAWLTGALPEEMRPDKIGILIDGEGGDEWAVIQECRPGALESQVGRELISWLSSLAPNLRHGVRIEPYGAHRGVSDAGDRLPGLFREIAPKVLLYVGVGKDGIAPTGNRQQTRKVGTGRNDLCPCGSGKKYKHCCLRHTEGR